MMSGHPGAFHRKHGGNIQLFESNIVVHRVASYTDAVVFTEQPIPNGAMFQVKLLDKGGPFRGSIKFGFTDLCPDDHPVPNGTLDLYGSANYWILSYSTVHHNGEETSVSFDLDKLGVGQSIGCLVNKEGELRYFVDGKDQGVGWTGVPLDKPLWGIADVYGCATKIKSEFLCGVDMCPSGDHEWARNVCMMCKFCGYCTGYGSGCCMEGQPRRDKGMVCGCGSGDSGCSKCGCCRKCEAKKRDHQSPTKQEELAPEMQQEGQQLQEELSQQQARQQEVQQLQEQLAQQQQTRQQEVQQLQEQLSQQRQARQQEVQQLQGRLDTAQAEIQQLRAQPQHAGTQEAEFWQVPRQDVQVFENRILGRGGWGYVAEGKFRGQRVAIKRVYPNILRSLTLDQIRREVSTMAQVRHPNLVLFIASVLDDQDGPMIITEILNLSLRRAYEEKRLGSNKLRIFRDVAAALNYLHKHREPIIHGDISTANVLLEAMANNKWKAKLSDFGSVNLIRLATTLGEGAIVYTAPEAVPQPPNSSHPHVPQTSKIDVYSYGVLLCEVVTCQFPNPDNFQSMVEQVGRQWPLLHTLIRDSTKYNPDERPTMAYILEQLERPIGIVTSFPWT